MEPSSPHQVGITPEEHERVAKILSDNKIATRDLLKRSLDANSYDYISATYLLLAEQVCFLVLPYYLISATSILLTPFS